MTEQEYKKLLIENILNKFDKLNNIKKEKEHPTPVSLSK
mgnify:CR=1 FL=1